MNYKEFIETLLKNIYECEFKSGFINKDEYKSNMNEMREIPFTKVLKKFKKELTSLQTVAMEANRMEKNSWTK